jgi:hypothetical protein
MLGTSSTKFETNGLVCLLFFYRFHFELYKILTKLKHKILHIYYLSVPKAVDHIRENKYWKDLSSHRQKNDEKKSKRI